MRVALEGISFNYAPDDLKKTGAFNLRRNETQPVRLPEWLPDQQSGDEASPAAYAICSLPAEMTIQASFNCEIDPGTSIRVRAIAEFTDHVLGDVEPVEIANSGSSGFITLVLPDARVAVVGVGIHDIGWRWQFSSEPNVWTDFQTTRHRIYTVLARPSDPWEPKSTASDNIHQPWTEVLDYACKWAAGAAGDLDRAAELLTKEFFREVSKLVSYKKGASYAFTEFKCTSFLTLLKTGTGGNQIVNCDDCATVVSTFANILGCQLSQSSLGVSFKTNPVVPIGSKDFTCKKFRYHSVAWKGQCLEDDELFDGCLQIDEDVAPPLIPVQPTNLPFGNEKEGYKFSVCNSPHCHPIPEHPIYSRQRRKLGKGYLADGPISDDELLSELKRDFVFDSWPRSEEEPLQEDVSDKSLTSIFEQFSLIGWALQLRDHFKDDRFSNVFELLFQRADFSEGKLVAVTIYQCKDTADPNHNLLEILGRFEELDFKRMPGSDIGDVVFVDKDGTTIVFRRARWLAVVRSAGKQPVPIIGNAEIVAHGLTNISGDS
jgi:hypothetical protein